MLRSSWCGQLCRNGAGCASAQVQAVLVLMDNMLDSVQSGPGVLVDDGPHVGGGRLLLARSLLHDNHHTSLPLAAGSMLTILW